MLKLDVNEEGLLNPRTGKRTSLRKFDKGFYSGAAEPWLRDLATLDDHDVAEIALTWRTRAVRMNKIITAIDEALDGEKEVLDLVAEIKAISMEMKMEGA